MPDEQRDKPKPKRTVQFPSLEFRTAGWLFECWARRCADPETPTQRLAILKRKLIKAQAAIGEGTGTGATAKVPDEIVFHEHEVVIRAVCKVYAAPDDEVSCWKRSQLVDASCEYGVELPTGRTLEAKRPLFLLEQDVNDLEGSTPEKAPPRRKLAQKLTAELFGIKVDAVPKKLTRVRKEDRFHKPPSEAQKFLVAALMLKARSGTDRQTEKELTRILMALYESRYEAKAIYHLALHLSSMGATARTREAWRAKPGIDWDTVEEVIKALSNPPAAE